MRAAWKCEDCGHCKGVHVRVEDDPRCPDVGERLMRDCPRCGTKEISRRTKKGAEEERERGSRIREQNLAAHGPCANTHCPICHRGEARA